MSGIYALAEPDDLLLYEAMLDYPLEMPETPLVRILFANIPLPLIYYPEAQIALRCTLNGEEGWHVIDLCVDQFLPWIGNRFLEGTTRKFMARQLTLTQTESGHEGKAVEKTGNIFIKATFSNRNAYENLSCWEEEFLFRQAYIPCAHNKSNPLLALKRTRKKVQSLVIPTDFLMPINPVIQTGEVHISSASHHSWTRLIPTGSVVKGVYLS